MSANNFSLTRRQLLKIACGTIAGSVLWGCRDKHLSSSIHAVSKIYVFHNGTVLPVDDAFSEHEAFAFQDNKIIAIGSSDGAVREALDRLDIEFEDIGGKPECGAGIRDIDDTADVTLYGGGTQDGIGLCAGVTEFLQILDGVQAGLPVCNVHIQIMLFALFIH